MSKPIIQIYNAETGENIVREMTDDEYSNWQSIQPISEPTPTKEELMAELAALTAKINSLL